LRPWPASEPGSQESNTTPPPGPGETPLGFVSGELGCARRSRAISGGGGVARAGSRGKVKLPRALAAAREGKSARQSARL